VIQKGRKKPASRRLLGTYTPLVLFSVDNRTPSMVTSNKRNLNNMENIMMSGECTENVMSRQF
jgi:hypothetical protein